MVEHLLAKEGVAGSNPVFRSKPRQLGARLSSAPSQNWEKGEEAVRSDISSLHSRPPNYLLGGRQDDLFLLKG